MALSPSRKRLLSALEHQQLHIPDLHAIIEHWPETTSENLAELSSDYQKKLRGLSGSGKKFPAMQNAMLGLFSATWFPKATLERGKILTLLGLWLFVWDDEVDAEVGRLAGDLEAAARFRNDTLQFIKYSLGLTDQYCPVPENQIIALFKEIADATLDTYTLEQRERVWQKIEIFVNATAIEQGRRLSPELPTLDEYNASRMGTSAMYVISSFNEYARGLTPLSGHIMDDPNMQIIWDEANYIVWAINDLLSLKKEIQQQTVDSLVPILYQKFGQLDYAVSVVAEGLKMSVQRFDKAAAHLREKFSGDAEVEKSLNAFIESCQYTCTGSLCWSLKTGRYQIEKDSMAGGVTLTLD